MEKAYKYLSSVIMNFFNTLLSLLKILLQTKPGVKLPKATTNSCAILGNGPSLLKSLADHPDFFKNQDLLCVNSFSTSVQYTELKPKYYVLLDPSFWEANTDAIKDTMRCIKDKTSWPLCLFVPVKASNSGSFEQIAQNKNIRIVYYNYTVFKGFDKIGHWLYKHNLAMPQSQNVLVASIFLSINMGYKKVYLFGADHSWHLNLCVKADNRTYIKHELFYNDKAQDEYRPYYKTLLSKDTFQMHEIFELLTKTFLGYKVINKYAEYKKAKILNASEASFIDAFEQIKI